MMVTKPSSSLLQTLTSSAPQPPTISSSASLLSLHPLCGINPFSIPRITFSLHSPTSKQLIIKCGRSRETVSSITDMSHLFSIFEEIGLEEKETRFLFEKHPILQSSSPESVRNRLISLQSVGINGFALCRSIGKHPDILTAHEIDPFICFIRDELEGEIKPEKLERFLSLTEPRLLLGFSEKVKLLIENEIPTDKIVHVINNANLTKVFGYKSVQEIERTIIYLKRFGAIGLIVRRPALLNPDLDRVLIPRVRVLIELSGGDEEAVGVVLRKLPAILTYSAEHLENHIEFMISFAGLSKEEIFKIVLVYPNIFSVSKERKLHPRIEFLKHCGLNSNDIFKYLIKAPLYLSLSFEENLSKKLGFLVKIGYENRTKELAIAMGAVTRTSCENMQKLIGVFLDYELSCEDILAMSKKHPQVLQYNHESLEKKMEYLIEDMGREVGELLAFPAFLGYKLDDRIKLRYEVKRKIIGEGMSLNKLLSVSTERFSKKKKRSVCVENTVQ